MQTRKKMIYLCPRSPIPPVGGLMNKTLNQIRILQKHFDLSVVMLVDSNNEKATYEALRGEVSALYLINEPKWLCALRALKSLWNRRPLQINYFYSQKFQDQVRQLLPKMDLVFCNLARTTEYVLNESSTVPRYLDMSDSIGLHYLSAKEKTTSLFWRLIYAFEGQKMLDYEKSLIEKFDRVFLYNHREMSLLGGSARLCLLPHGVNQSILDRRYEGLRINPQRISFVGKMDYRPNIEAALWFEKNVFRLLPENFEFWIVGTKPAPEILALQARSRRVKVTGFVDDPFRILKESLCVVAPMVSGGGIQNKILEAMAVGTVNLVSPLAALPLVGVENGKHLWVCDGPSEWRDRILSLKVDSIEYRNMTAIAREYIEANYTWQAYEAKLIDAIGVE